MKYIINIVKKMFGKNLPLPNGRWSIEKCNKKIDHKIDLSNEDHCGPCGQYALGKIESLNDKKTNIYLEKPKKVT